MSAEPTAVLRPPEPALPAWRRALAEAVTDPAELLELLELPGELLPAARRAAELFGLRVPRGFVARMRPGDPADPLLLQVLPLARELDEAPGFTADPVGELGLVAPGNRPGDGLAGAGPDHGPGALRKYRGRALLIVTGACAVHCRYCFRRHFPYAESHPGWSGWGETLRRLAADPELREVILSGGDPLSVADERLEELVDAVAAVPQVERLRIHSRHPVVLPERVDERLVGWLGATRLRTVVVVHANHAREIDGAVRSAFARLRGAGATLLNQSVLLAGVNDSADALVELSEALFEAGALPYYLHLLDRVQGAAHFEVPEARARRLVGEAAARLPGYLVPRLAREAPGAPAKVVIAAVLP